MRKEDGGTKVPRKRRKKGWYREESDAPTVERQSSRNHVEGQCGDSQDHHVQDSGCPQGILNQGGAPGGEIASERAAAVDSNDGPQSIMGDAGTSAPGEGFVDSVQALREGHTTPTEETDALDDRVEAEERRSIVLAAEIGADDQFEEQDAADADHILNENSLLSDLEENGSERGPASRSSRQ